MNGLDKKMERFWDWLWMRIQCGRCGARFRSEDAWEQHWYKEHD